jgi:hypothetical protein
MCWSGIGRKAVAIKHASINCFGLIWKPIQRKWHREKQANNSASLRAVRIHFPAFFE